MTTTARGVTTHCRGYLAHPRSSAATWWYAPYQGVGPRATLRKEHETAALPRVRRLLSRPVGLLQGILDLIPVEGMRQNSDDSLTQTTAWWGRAESGSVAALAAA